MLVELSVEFFGIDHENNQVELDRIECFCIYTHLQILSFQCTCSCSPVKIWDDLLK